VKPDPSKHFFGKRCRHCKGRERFISDGGCIACTRERVRLSRARHLRIVKRTEDVGGTKGAKSGTKGSTRAGAATP
jgi:hypothetical protein